MSTFSNANDLAKVSTPALEQAIACCGTQTELARRIGGRIRTGHIYHWLRNGIPAERCPAIEEATEGRVTRYQLRPDVFGDAPPPPVQEAG